MKKVIVMIGFMACIAAELQSCHPPPPKRKLPPHPGMTVFSNYPESTFKEQIPQRQHYYLPVPKAGCRKAITNTLSQITSATLAAVRASKELKVQRSEAVE